MRLANATCPACLQTPKELAEQSARTVLGLFKKQHKRRDPNLRPWEEGGSRIKVGGNGGLCSRGVQPAWASAGKCQPGGTDG